MPAGVAKVKGKMITIVARAGSLPKASGSAQVVNMEEETEVSKSKCKCLRLTEEKRALRYDLCRNERDVVTRSENWLIQTE